VTMDSNLLESNLLLFAHTSPKLAIHIAEVTAKCPPPHAKEWFSFVPVGEAEVIYVFGIGDGEAYLEAKNWLHADPKRRLIFFEDQLGILRHFLEGAVAGELLRDPQAELHGFSKLSNEMFKDIGWSAVLQPVFVTAIPDYAKHRGEEAQEFEQLVLYESSRKDGIVDEYLKFGIVFYRNFYRNILALPDSYRGSAMFGQFPGVPAIICGAGPSLEKQLPLLKTLSDKALIIAGGSALKALQEGGVFPHFGAGIDPNPAQADRIRDWEGDVPFFYRPRMHSAAFNLIRGPRLYLNGAGGYDTAQWFEENLGISGKSLDEGHNVVNFCTEIAHELGCNPIIFVGADLAFTNRAAYAPGVVEKTHEISETTISRPDIYGQPVETLWKWVAESEWLAKYAEDHPDLTMINATEGGIGIPGVSNLPLSDVMIKGSDSLKKMIQEKMKPLTISLEEVLDLMREMSVSLTTIIASFETMIQEIEPVRKKIVEGEILETLQTGLAVLTETELVEEPAYQAVLDIFNTMYARIHHQEFRDVKLIEDDQKQQLKILELTESKYRFLKAVAEANKLLLQDSLYTQRGSK